MADEERALGGMGSEIGSKTRDRVRNDPNVDAQRLVTGRAWEDFCDRLKEAGQHILAESAPPTPRDRAEGFRHLANVTQAGIRHVFNMDPSYPRWLRNPDSTSKAGAENADNLYLFCKIRSNHRYRITGRRNTAMAFLLETKEGYMQLGDTENYATLDSEQLVTNADGTFEILLARERPAGNVQNFVPLHEHATQCLIRQYIVDWDEEVLAEFEIVDLDTEGASPEPLTPVDVARMLDDAADWIETTQRVWNEWGQGYRDRRREGVLAPAELYVGGADDIRYGNDGYELGPDEALIITGEPPEARYWHYQLVDLWMASMDYANRQTSLNQHQLQIDTDGRYRVVIAHRDPGVPNWLDTAGREQGIVQYRYVWTHNNPLPTLEKVGFDEIRAMLPADTPLVTAASRREAIARRQAHLRRREPTC
ncbi:MAG: hypothetical protein CL908_15240 [Deltaproteobacteria bacterium]|nr:hypothetical protein [Deltaproteobacteria bacterium]